MSQQLHPLPPLMGGSSDEGDMSQTLYFPQESSEMSGGLPINLDSLRDGPPGSKPFYPYSTLLRYAIKGSPNQKLLLEDIYFAIESRFPYFKTAPAGWKNSIRHNLTLNPCFEKVARPLTDRGKGHYWTVNESVDPRTGVHRVRKKKGRNGKNSEEGDVDYGQGESGYDVPQQYAPEMNEAGSSRQEPYPQSYPPFDPNFPMMPGGIRFVPPPGLMIPAGGDVEVDEHGNVDWRSAWLKELAHLQQVTADQDKAQVDAEWYRMMLFSVRGALMAPPNPGEAIVQMPGAMVDNSGDQQQ